MFETISRLWVEGKLKEPNLDKAISLKWITEEQKIIIMAQEIGEI
jgi:hypothetical protein